MVNFENTYWAGDNMWWHVTTQCWGYNELDMNMFNYYGVYMGKPFRTTILHSVLEWNIKEGSITQSSKQRFDELQLEFAMENHLE